VQQMLVRHSALLCFGLQELLGLDPDAPGGDAAGGEQRQRQRAPDSELQKRLASRWNPRVVGSTSL
jgi:hypothetical protein